MSPHTNLEAVVRMKNVRKSGFKRGLKKFCCTNINNYQICFKERKKTYLNAKISPYRN